GKKITVFKYKPKQRYRRKQGHRQLLTHVAIESIGLPKAPQAKAKKKADAKSKSTKSKSGASSKTSTKKSKSKRKKE
ncbi:MAG: bL21 family ribosomal protein, partial [Anaerolineales bacterium]